MEQRLARMPWAVSQFTQIFGLGSYIQAVAAG